MFLGGRYKACRSSGERGCSIAFSITQLVGTTRDTLKNHYCHGTTEASQVSPATTLARTNFAIMRQGETQESARNDKRPRLVMGFARRRLSRGKKYFRFRSGPPVESREQKK